MLQSVAEKRCGKDKQSSSRALVHGLVAIFLFGATFRSTNISRDLNLLMALERSQVLEYILNPTNIEPSHQVTYSGYIPAPAEAFVLNHTHDLGLANPVPQLAPTCHIWTDPNSTPYHAQMLEFVRELDAYYSKIEKFELGITDLRRNLTKEANRNEVCDLVKLHPDGLPGLFNNSKQLSYTSSGWVEPLMVPMRHPNFCLQGRSYLMTMNYMVHDFHALCLKLKPTSRTVFVDMGASLSFHGNQKSPVLFVLDLYKKFGIKFDHIYAYEMRPHPADQVFAQVPEHFEAAFHWINLGVAADTQSRQNPFKMLVENYDEDDLVIVKLDVDTPALERQLAEQVKTDPRLARMIDHFYFEHHVNQEELAPNWGRGPDMTETVAESLTLFSEIRQRGIPAHFWV